MTFILSLLAIFIFVIFLFFASLKIIDLIFATQIQLKPSYMKGIFSTMSLLLWFGFGLVSTFLISSVIVKIPQIIFGNNEPTSLAEMLIENKDCPQLIDTIYLTENQIYKIENHRYIEEVSPIFTIKLEYKKGVKELEAAAEEYLNLNLSKNSQHYSQKIAQKLQNKADLFRKRIDIVEENKGVKQIIELLQQMDNVTQQRRNIINGVEKQCGT